MNALNMARKGIYVSAGGYQVKFLKKSNIKEWIQVIIIFRQDLQDYLDFYLFSIPGRN